MSDRKYKQRGYMEDDGRGERKPRRAPAAEGGRPRVEGAPRGRGVGLPGEAVFKCSRCGHRLQKLASIDSESLCPGCNSPLHSCTNCSFFNTGARFECSKPIAERVESKTKANSCRFFQPKTVRDLKPARPERPDDARAAFDALFKK